MKKQEAIEQMQLGKRLTHRYFTKEEWVTINNEGFIQFEDNVTMPLEEFLLLKNNSSWDSDWNIHPSTYLSWRQLKEAIEKLPMDQLDMPVYSVGEETATPVLELFLVPADIYRHREDPEDRGSLEELKEIHGDDFDEFDYILTTLKGTALLSEEF